MNSRPTAMEALAGDPSRAGLVLDFDGVLAPIVEDPATSAMPDRVAASLTRLTPVLGLLAIISGRPAEFLAGRVRVPGIPLLGSYGIEHFRDGVPVIMNLTEMAEADAKRLVDFAAGLAFGLHGSMERVTNRVFLLSPANVQVTAEDKARIAEGGFFNQS